MAKNKEKIKQQVKLRRARRTRRRLKVDQLSRLSVHRSLKHIYAQIIDDSRRVTLVSASDIKMKATDKNKTAKAESVGREIARLALQKDINKVIFDRGGYLYHGRVKALAEAARAEGLKF